MLASSDWSRATIPTGNIKAIAQDICPGLIRAARFKQVLVSYRPLLDDDSSSRAAWAGFEICASRGCRLRPVGVSDCEFKSQLLRVSSSASRRAQIASALKIDSSSAAAPRSPRRSITYAHRRNAPLRSDPDARARRRRERPQAVKMLWVDKHRPTRVGEVELSCRVGGEIRFYGRGRGHSPSTFLRAERRGQENSACSAC